MATTRPRYQIKSHKLIEREDLPTLPRELQTDFSLLYSPTLAVDPYKTRGVPSHTLTGDLSGYRALEIDWAGIAYRLVYRVSEKPAPRRVLILSFDKHDSAYDKAKARSGRR